MTKKRKVRRAKAARSQSGTTNGAAVQSAAEADSDRRPRNVATVEELEKEYSYVLRDLRRVGLIALLMFILLIVLNLLLQ